ncbi:transglutaminase-like domain-containing protein [Microbacterium nymphoidis]|uniref:transglutaminase-like domain-containing protein n=1 Tax=Microbacterium nymphoidis TaxID=2898586 RepID=UPI001E3EA4A9|nr:transglutaminase-like domain-containing protein [Microbacterium nymphoidis]MCD2499521.1 transglutaminase-like domain-containing protein [Microbacterium nymphoidis]
MTSVREGLRGTRARRMMIDVIAVVVLCLIIGCGFQPVFDGLGFLLTVGIGTGLGVAIAVVASLRAWALPLTVLATVAGYFLVGAAAALPGTTFFAIPTLESFRSLTTGIVTAWKSFITAGLPLSTDEHALVPFILMTVCGVTSASAALRLKHAAWALLPLGLTAAAVALLGSRTAELPVVAGAAFAVVLIAWLGVRHALDPSRHLLHASTEATAVHLRAIRRRRVVAAAAVLLIAMVGGSAGGAYLFDGGRTDRVVARDHVVPPLQPHDYTSPLQSFRAFVRDHADSAQFTITGLPTGARVRLAALDAYDGLVLQASDGASAGSGRFLPLSGGAADESTLTRVGVVVGDYTGVWVPTVGAVQELTYDPAARTAGATERRNTYYNDQTQTALNTAGLAPGMVYTVETTIERSPSRASLADAPFAAVRMPPAVNVPEEVAALASQATADATTPLEKVEALAGWLSSTGYFSHGLEGDAPSLSGHGAVRLHDFLDSDTIVGDDEQYAVTMMLMAAQLGIPARVVMGWYPSGDGAITDPFVANGDNLHAWVEVAFAGHGWVAFDPAPPPDKVPRESAPRPRSDPRPQVLQPPIPPQEAVDDTPLAPNDRDNGEEQDKPEEASIDWGSIALSAAVVGGGALLLAPGVIVLLIKEMRRRRRQRSVSVPARIAGGWDEIVDRAVDLRVPVRAGATRVETARTLQRAFPDVAVLPLAHRADAGVFGPATADGAEGEAFWDEAGRVVHGMRLSVGRARRMRARISLRSVIGARGRSRGGGGPDGDTSALSATAERGR